MEGHQQNSDLNRPLDRKKNHSLFIIIIFLFRPTLNNSSKKIIHWLQLLLQLYRKSTLMWQTLSPRLNRNLSKFKNLKIINTSIRRAHNNRRLLHCRFINHQPRGINIIQKLRTSNQLIDHKQRITLIMYPDSW